MHIPSQLYAFTIQGTPVACEEYGNGHINQTLKITTDAGRTYILQQVNHHVFKEPVKLMENASGVANFIRKASGNKRASLHFLPTTQGTYCHKDPEGNYWRAYDYIEGFCLDAPQSDEDFYESALAFGHFQEWLSEFPAETLHETIPEFHNTIDRFRKLRAAIQADTAGRAAKVEKEIALAFSMEELGSTLQTMRQEGRLPLRVTHNDTKLNNVILDPETRKGLCVLDLDTVMPGLSAYDFGDSIRFGATVGDREDDENLENMGIDLHLFEVYTRGFLSAAPSLTPLEVEVLPLGAFTMALEVGIRFLTDYLDGDVYFKTAYPEHNLIRCRSQLYLASDMKKHLEEMNDIVHRVASEVTK